MAARIIDQPGRFRPVTNYQGADIQKKLIVKYDGTNVDGVMLAAAAADRSIGVTSEIIYAGKNASIQREGKAVVTSGAAIAIGQELTSNASGQAVPVAAWVSTAAPDKRIGVAVTAATAAGQDVEVELFLS